MGCLPRVHITGRDITNACTGDPAGRPYLPQFDPTLASAAQDIAAVFLHTLAMLVVMAVVALLVYEKLGVAVLRRAWLNLDLIWAGAIVAAGVITLFT